MTDINNFLKRVENPDPLKDQGHETLKRYLRRLSFTIFMELSVSRNNSKLTNPPLKDDPINLNLKLCFHIKFA